MESLFVHAGLSLCRASVPNREARIYDIQGGSEENQWVSVKGFQHAHARLSIKACMHRSNDFLGKVLVINISCFSSLVVIIFSPSAFTSLNRTSLDLRSVTTKTQWHKEFFKNSPSYFRALAIKYFLSHIWR